MILLELYLLISDSLNCLVCIFASLGTFYFRKYGTHKMPQNYLGNPGAYHFVCQILLNKPPAMQHRFYAVVEEKGLKDDILAIKYILCQDLESLTFTDPDTAATHKIMVYILQSCSCGRPTLSIAHSPIEMATNV